MENHNLERLWQARGSILYKKRDRVGYVAIRNLGDRNLWWQELEQLSWGGSRQVAESEWEVMEEHGGKREECFGKALFGKEWKLQLEGKADKVSESHSVMSDTCHPMDCSPPGSSVHEIFQARLLEWVAISYSKSREETHLSWYIHRVVSELKQAGF